MQWQFLKCGLMLLLLVIKLMMSQTDKVFIVVCHAVVELQFSGKIWRILNLEISAETPYFKFGEFYSWQFGHSTKKILQPLQRKPHGSLLSKS